jgi:hypothetical protein
MSKTEKPEGDRYKRDRVMTIVRESLKKDFESGIDRFKTKYENSESKGLDALSISRFEITLEGFVFVMKLERYGTGSRKFWKLFFVSMNRRFHVQNVKLNRGIPEVDLQELQERFDEMLVAETMNS